MSVDKGTVECTLGSCGCSVATSFQVLWQGAQKDVLSGDIEGKVNLAPLAKLKDLYGLGPLREVTGEVTILNSRPYIARVRADGGIALEESFANHACFLVYTQVERWRKVRLGGSIADDAALEVALPNLARENGIDPDFPFPFLLKGQPERVSFHVLNKTDGATHSPQLHEKAKVHYDLEGVALEVIGFHSHKHRGIFTPGHSSLHMHLCDEAETVSGHVDALSFPQGIDLYLPVA